MIKAPSVGKILREFIQQHRLYQSAWARDAGQSAQTVARYLKQDTMQVDTLFAICQHLNHNFLRDIANLLPPEMPPLLPADQTTEVAVLKAENEQLKIQVATLEKALSLVGGN